MTLRHDRAIVAGIVFGSFATFGADGISTDALLGPFALLVGCLIAVAVLWREDRRVYRERIDDLRTQRDFNAAGWKTQTDANAALVVELAAARRHRRSYRDET